MTIPKSLKPRVEKFVTLILTMVINEELDRGFYKKGMLDPNYQISLYATVLLPAYIDSRIEIKGKINDKEIDLSVITCQSLTDRKVDPNLIKEVVDNFMKLRIKEIK